VPTSRWQIVECRTRVVGMAALLCEMTY
jgi:hypothetical protein